MLGGVLHNNQQRYAAVITVSISDIFTKKRFL
jgi:hypothetical protein